MGRPAYDYELARVVGGRIRTALWAQGMSQKDLAKELGVSDSGVSFWVNGDRTPAIEHLVQLAEILNVTTDWLLGRENAAGS